MRIQHKRIPPPPPQKAWNGALIKNQISGNLDLSTPRLQNCQITNSMLFCPVSVKKLNITLDRNEHYS